MSCRVNTRRLGCRIQMPRIGLGTWRMQDSAKSEDALYRALELGYRHLDTAYIYGNEATIGKVLKKWFKAGNSRDDLFITSKLPPFGLREEEVSGLLQQSLDKLCLPYIDLYLAHMPFGFFPTKAITLDPTESGSLEWSKDKSKDEQIKWDYCTDHVSLWQAMEDEVDKKKTRYIGVSNFNIRQIENVVNHSRIRPACLQVEMHPFLQQKKLACYCRCNDIVLVAYSPMGSAGNEVAQKFEPALKHPTILEIAKELRVTPGQVILAYILHLGAIPIPKSDTEQYMKENLQALHVELTPKHMREIGKLDKGEEARVFNFRQWKGILKHPMYPWKLPRSLRKSMKDGKSKSKSKSKCKSRSKSKSKSKSKCNLCNTGKSSGSKSGQKKGKTSDQTCRSASTTAAGTASEAATLCDTGASDIWKSIWNFKKDDSCGGGGSGGDKKNKMTDCKCPKTDGKKHKSGGDKGKCGKSMDKEKKHGKMADCKCPKSSSGGGKNKDGDCGGKPNKGCK